MSLDYSSLAFLDGWDAHSNNITVEENPYHPRTQERSNRNWEAGWCERFGRVKHGGNLEEFEV